MTNQKKASQPASRSRPPKKLIPRPAAAVEVVAAPVSAVLADNAAPLAAPAIGRAEAATSVAAGPASVAPTSKGSPPRKPSREDATVAKHQKVLAEALVMAQAINYEQPKVMSQNAGKAKKPAKPKKPKLVRDSYAMPEVEYAQIAELKKRLAGVGVAVKKSELLRGGIAVLAALDDMALQAVLAGVERIKTGRPAK